MSYKIGLRTVKTAIAVSAAIMLSEFLQLNFYIFSAIITILCVQNSKQKTIKSASARFMACMLAIPFSFVFFEGIGYKPFVMGAAAIILHSRYGFNQNERGNCNKHCYNPAYLFFRDHDLERGFK